jgi:hypothetical protein
MTNTRLVPDAAVRGSAEMRRGPREGLIPAVDGLLPRRCERSQAAREHHVDGIVDVDDKGGAHVHGAVDDHAHVDVDVDVDDHVKRARARRRKCETGTTRVDRARLV